MLQGLRTVAAAAMGGQLPAEGSLAAQMADVMAELQSLPRNEQLRTSGAAGAPPLHKSFPGSAVQAEPLQVCKTVDLLKGLSRRGIIERLNVAAAVLIASIAALWPNFAHCIFHRPCNEWTRCRALR